jgi:hypothetical protein
VYGVLGYLVSQNKREIGIRMALGANHAAVLGLVVRYGMSLAAIGMLNRLSWRNFADQGDGHFVVWHHADRPAYL